MQIKECLHSVSIFASRPNLVASSNTHFELESLDSFMSPLEFCSPRTHSASSKIQTSPLESCFLKSYLNLVALITKSTRTDSGMDVLKDIGGDRANFLLDKAKNSWFCVLVFEDE